MSSNLLRSPSFLAVALVTHALGNLSPGAETPDLNLRGLTESSGSAEQLWMGNEQTAQVFDGYVRQFRQAAHVGGLL